MTEIHTDKHYPYQYVCFRITEALEPADVQASLQTLSEAERTRYARFRFARDQRDYAIAHDLLRRCLSRYEPVHPVDWQFELEPRGKPQLASTHHLPENGGPSLLFNLSHTRGLVAAGVARRFAIGIDVEVLRRFADATDVARRFFSPSEVEALEACPEEARLVRFVELWTLKEAFLKATGEGVSERLREISFDLGQPEVLSFSAAYPLDLTNWHFALYAPTPASRLAVAGYGPAHPSITMRRDSGNGENVPSDFQPLRACRRCRDVVGPAAVPR